MSDKTHEVGRGARTRFDKLGGDRIDMERRKGQANGVMLSYGKRWCEACKAKKPKGNRKAVKGWQCDDCRAGAQP